MLQTVKQFRSFADLVFFYLIEKHRYRVPWILRFSSPFASPEGRKSGADNRKLEYSGFARKRKMSFSTRKIGWTL
jgi:hypothetical protein